MNNLPGAFARPLSISALLITGFSLLCGLTVVLAGTAAYALQAVLEGQARLLHVNEWHASVLGARAAEKTYRVDAADSARDQVLSSVQGLMQELTQGLPGGLATDPALLRASQDYLARFQGFSATRQRTQATQASMQSQAEAAKGGFEGVEQDLLEALGEAIDQGRASLDLVTQADNAMALMRKLMAVRSSEWAFARQPDGARYDQWLLLMSDLQSSTQALANGAAETQRQTLEAALQALGGYRQAFEEYRLRAEESRASEQSMDGLAQQMLTDFVALKQQVLAQQQTLDRRAYAWLLGMTLLALVLSAAAAWLIRRRIVTPLRYTAQVAGEVAAGSLSPSLVVTRQDELGQVLLAMQGMTRSLHQIMSRIDQGSRRLTLACGELSTATAAAEQGAREQSREADSTAAAMEQVNASLAQVARHTEHSLQSAQAARSGYEAGERDVAAVALQSRELTGQMDSASQAMQRLDEESGRIAGVLAVIHALAEQTNLAGAECGHRAPGPVEKGRGFSVVADEAAAPGPTAPRKRRPQESDAMTQFPAER
ncbi:methyl-accepting chemotaxis protein, partial [Pseudomonas sp. MAFF 302030]